MANNGYNTGAVWVMVGLFGVVLLVFWRERVMRAHIKLLFEAFR